MRVVVVVGGSLSRRRHHECRPNIVPRAIHLISFLLLMIAARKFSLLLTLVTRLGGSLPILLLHFEMFFFNLWD